MICKHSSVLFFYTIYIFSCNSNPSNKLKFLFITENYVIKCSAQEYLVINDWFKLTSSNISCPNHADIFEKQSPDIYNWSSVYAECFSNNKTFWTYSHIEDLPPMDNKMKMTKIGNRLSLLTGTINADNHEYAFKARLTSQVHQIFIDQGSQKWSSNGIYIFYMTFGKQPIICRFKMNLTAEVQNEKCTNNRGRKDVLCYYEPKSKPSLNTVDWKQLDNFIDDKSDSPSNWKDKGGYYLDVRLLKTSTTSTTTISSTSKPTSLSDSTEITTASTKTTTTVLSITSSTSALISSTHRDTFTPLTIDNTSTIISTPSETSIIVSPSMESTDLDHIPITKREIATTIIPAAVQVPHNKSGTLKKSSNKSKSPTIPLNKNPSSTKNASSRSILLLIVLMCCIIIVLISFFIFLYRRNKKNNDKSPLDRNDSDESYSSDTNESEINPSTEYDEETMSAHRTSTRTKPELSVTMQQSDIDRSRKGGRMFSQLDPDAL